MEKTGATLIPFRPRARGVDHADDAHLERVIEDIQACRIRARALAFEITELARQFVEDDLQIRTGPGRGNALSLDGRRVRMQRLGRFHREYWRNRERETRLMAILTNLENARADDGLADDARRETPAGDLDETIPPWPPRDSDGDA